MSKNARVAVRSHIDNRFGAQSGISAEDAGAHADIDESLSSGALSPTGPRQIGRVRVAPSTRRGGVDRKATAAQALPEVDEVEYDQS